MRTLFLLAGLLCFAFICRTQEYKWFELTIDPNPKYIENWSFNFNGRLDNKDHLRMVFNFSRFENWEELLVGIDVSVVQRNKLFGVYLPWKIRTGLQAGDNSPKGEFAFRAYIKEEIYFLNLVDYKPKKNLHKNVGLYLTAYQNLHKNSRRAEEFYYDNSLGIGLNF